LRVAEGFARGLDLGQQGRGIGKRAAGGLGHGAKGVAIAPCADGLGIGEVNQRGVDFAARAGDLGRGLRQGEAMPARVAAE